MRKKGIGQGSGWARGAWDEVWKCIQVDLRVECQGSCDGGSFSGVGHEREREAGEGREWEGWIWDKVWKCLEIWRGCRREGRYGLGGVLGGIWVDGKELIDQESKGERWAWTKVWKWVNGNGHSCDGK